MSTELNKSFIKTSVKNHRCFLKLFLLKSRYSNWSIAISANNYRDDYLALKTEI
jgi:hypothetical protein